MNARKRIPPGTIVLIFLFFFFLFGSIFVLKSQFSPHFVLYGRLDRCPSHLPKVIEFHHIPIGRPLRCEKKGAYAIVYLSIRNSFRERLPSAAYLATGKNSTVWDLMVVDPLSPPIQPNDTIIIRDHTETREIQYLTKAFQLIIQGYRSRSILSEKDWIQSLQQSEPFRHLLRHNGKFILSHSKMLTVERQQWKKACQALTEPDMARTRKGRKFVNTLFSLLECGPLTVQNFMAGGPVASR